ncbi:MAG: serine/threonine-protein kinase, partial [Isosphaeraceae bacterium]
GAQLQHENLVRIYDEGEANGRCYLVMEYIEGKTIGQLIVEGGPLAYPLASRLARQVALGLEHAQRKGLIHRDVNPWNILVTHEGTAKLTDMGLAIDLADADRLTRDGATVGTFDYVSPEQARHSHDVDTRSDIYSLGCSLYHMLSGRVPFPSTSLPEKLFSHQTAEADALHELVPTVPPALSAVVAKMMRKAPERRYETPQDVANALAPFTDEAGLGRGEITPPSHVFEPRTTRVGPLAEVRSPRTTTAVGLEASSPASKLNGTHTIREVPANDVGATFARSPLAATQFMPPTPDPSRPSAPAVSRPIPPPRPVEPEPPSPPQPASSPVAAAPAPAPQAIASPITETRVESGGLNLALDLGPEPSLKESLSSTRIKTRSRSGDRTVTSTGDAPDLPKAWLSPVTLSVLGALGLLGALFVFLSLLGERPRGISTGRELGKSPDPAGSNARPDRPSVPAPKVTLPELQGREVAVANPDGSYSVEPDFRSAVRSVSGGRGHVVLHNPKPYTFAAADALMIGSGRVTIKAGEGVKPVLRVEVKGKTPFLSTRADSPLTIEGVTIEVRHVEPGKEPAPVIAAGGSLTLTHCAFRVIGHDLANGPLPGSRAIANEGGIVNLTGCTFENFDCAVDLKLFASATVSASQCLFVNRRAATAGAPAGGWAFRVEALAGGPGRGGRVLKLDHCTIHTPGALELLGFSRELPAKIDLEACAVLADALVGWGTSSTNADRPTEAKPIAPPDRDALSWSGEGNQYDLRGQAWVDLRPPGEPPTPWTDGPKNLEAWTKVLGPERDPILRPIRFASDPASTSERVDPADFTLIDQSDAPAVGAEPKRVGPNGALRAASEHSAS